MKKISEMTLEEKIGQLLIIGFEGKEYNEALDELLKSYKCGNVILFTRNFSSASQMKQLTSALYKHITEEVGVLPLIAIDQEGGQVTRLMKDVTFAPSQMTSVATLVEDAPYKVGRVLGRDMIMLGINMDLAPCLEINKDLKNCITNVRSYGEDPDKIGKHAHHFILGLRDYGILSCAKHFPGAGDDEVDSHLELPIINIDKETMDNNSLVPFKENLDVDAIMTTHTLFTAYDSVPTTMSKAVLNGLLRTKLKYQGLIMSDCVEMKAIADNYGSAEGALEALKAGCDLVLVCHTRETQIDAYKLIYNAVQNGYLKEEEIDEKVMRILLAKERIIPFLKTYFKEEEAFKASKENNELVQQIVDGSLTLIKGDTPRMLNDTLILTPLPMVSSVVEDEFDERSLTKALENEFPKLKVIEFNEIASNRNEILDAAKTSKQIIIFSYDLAYHPLQKEIITEILETYQDVYVISLKGPMDYYLLKNVNNYATLYEYTPNSIRTCVKYLKGIVTPNGKLPK